MLDPIRERREAFAKDPEIVQEVLRGGIEQTRAVAANHGSRARSHVHRLSEALAPQAVTS